MTMTGDQETTLFQLLKLEKQLRQAGISIAEDIPYHEAKEKVDEISTRMHVIGGSDVTHEDRQIQQSLREEYFKLEQDLLGTSGTRGGNSFLLLHQHLLWHHQKQRHSRR